MWSQHQEPPTKQRLEILQQAQKLLPSQLASDPLLHQLNIRKNTASQMELLNFRAHMASQQIPVVHSCPSPLPVQLPASPALSNTRRLLWEGNNLHLQRLLQLQQQMHPQQHAFQIPHESQHIQYPPQQTALWRAQNQQPSNCLPVKRQASLTPSAGPRNPMPPAMNAGFEEEYFSSSQPACASNRKAEDLTEDSPKRKAKDTLERPVKRAKGSKEDSSPARKQAGTSPTKKKASKSKPPKADKKSQRKDTKWLASLEDLKKYKEEYGNCIVPRGYSSNPKLASWVAEQRKQYKLLSDGKQSSITAERVALLNGLDFAWNAQEAAWARHMGNLKKFRDDHGHCHVSLQHPEYPKLGLWIKEQRRHYTLLKQGKQSHMTKERVDQLNCIGFCWDTHEATWLERFRELSELIDKNGQLPKTSDNPKLGTWVHHQRRQYRRYREGLPCHITEERIKSLESIGFIWSPRGRINSSSSCDSFSSDSDSEISRVENL